VAEQETWTHRTVETNGINLHCVVQGEGPLVILLHGFPECWYSWRHQIPVLAERFKVVAPDMRGYNLSDKPSGVESYTMNKLTNDVAGVIEAFGCEKAHVIAHDWGGAVAWMFAVTYPDMLDRLVAMNCPHPAVFAKDLLSNPRQLLRSWYMFFFQIPGLPEAAFRAFDYAQLRRAFTGWAIDKAAFSAEDLDELAKAASQPGALTGGINYYRAVFRGMKLSGMRAMATSFPRIKSPTMIIWAEEDRALGRELTYGLDPYFETPPVIHYIPNCSHWVQQEQPLLVNEYLEEFL
jgi:pimeloyl-ACP methyl ester carboxylesterase